MKFLALLAALLIEQVWPLRADNALHNAYGQFAHTLEHYFNAGEYRQGVMAWMLAVVPLALGVLVVGWALQHAGASLAWAWGVGVLYATVGFRQFSHLFNEINMLMKNGDLAGARETLARWRGDPCSDLSSEAVARLSIELGLLASHRSVFGPIMWFVVLGPAGAVLYRAAASLDRQWGRRQEPESGTFGVFAQRAFEVLDWLPARLTAISFAVVGNFQDAVDCWRNQAQTWPQHSHGAILASGAGALGVKLGGELTEYGRVHFRPELGAGEEADVGYMAGAVGLIWRALVMWMFLIFIVTLSHTLG